MEEFEIYETHISRLLLADGQVYKWKKPVRFAFIDLTTPEARLRDCRSEVELNRRLAPDVYEGVGRFTYPDGREEPVVVMRRMPDDRRLSVLVRQDDPALGPLLTDVAATLAEFHDRAETGPEISEDCTEVAVRRLWQSNLDELRAVSEDIIEPQWVEAAWEAASVYLAGRTAVFHTRLRMGRAVDGHGDLLCDDIFLLPDGPRILDCIEFDEHLRHLDPLADIASLAMDLENHGRPDLGAAFLDTYKVLSGDDWPDSLAHLHIAYRATVRAKVACLRALKARGDVEAASVAQARALMSLALRHLRAGAVRMVIVGGLPGTGKTTLSEQLSAATGWSVLSSDVVRKRLAGLEPDTEAGSAFGSGIYSGDMTALVYDELMDEAGTLMRAGQSVIIDASWTRRSWRDAAQKVAERCLAEFVPVRCRVSKDLARSRIRHRMLSGPQPSDATPSIYDEMAAALEPWYEAISVDTSEDSGDAAAAILEAIGVEP